MKKKCSFVTVLIFAFFLSFMGNSQSKRQFKVHTIAFYNVENLFDTINDPNKFDEASPIMELKSGREEVYVKKVQNMAYAISKIGADINLALSSSKLSRCSCPHFQGEMPVWCFVLRFFEADFGINSESGLAILEKSFTNFR